MKREVSFEDIRQFLVSHLDISEIIITPQTLLVKDLGVTWEKGLAFLSAFSTYFEVDILECNVKAHFAPSKPIEKQRTAYNIVEIILIFLGSGKNPYSVLPHVDVSASDLIRFANEKRWPKIDRAF